MLKLGKELITFRKAKGLTQHGLAQMLDVTQAHISRIESGSDKYSDTLNAKILSLIKAEEWTRGSGEESYEFELKIISDYCWNYAYFVFGENASGDRVRINTKSLNERTAILHCDAEGHDSIAKRMADNLVIGFETAIASIANELSSSPECIYKSLNDMYKSTKDFWRGAASSNIFLLNRQSNQIQIINAGMPDIWLIEKGKSVTNISEIKWRPIGNSSKKYYPFSTNVEIKKGDIIFSYSDGFAEIFGERYTRSLKTHMESICRALKGDAESVGNKLLSILGDVLKSSTIEDNMSFLIISKT